MIKNKYDSFPSLRLYDALGVPYVVHDAKWLGPLWTGHCMMLDTTDSFEDAGFFHELCHWIEASPTQRKSPDFALGKQVNSGDVEFATSTSPLHHQRGTDLRRPKGHNAGWGETTVPLSEATRQEANACYALLLYEPLSGVWGWDGPPPTGQINSAAYDCNMDPSDTITKARTRTAKITRTFGVSSATVRTYLTAVRKHEWASK